MPVLEAPPPPPVITNPVVGSTLIVYSGKGALYKSGTLLFPMLAEEVEILKGNRHMHAHK